MAGRPQVLSGNEVTNLVTNSSGEQDSCDVGLLNLDSDDEVMDNLEADQLYDSDDGEEFVPDPDDENDEDVDERDAARSKKWRIRFFASNPIEGTASTSTSAAPASDSVSVHASNSADAVITSPNNGGRRRKRRQNAEVPPIVDFNKTTISSASNFSWSCKPQHMESLTKLSGNISCEFTPGPTLAAEEVIFPEEAFKLLFSDDIIQAIVTWTNKRIELASEKLARKSAQCSPTDATEILALVGVLIVAGQQKDNHLSTYEMWSSVTGCPLYRAAMSRARFEFLLACLTFDNPDTRDERRKQDKFAAVRQVWHSFISNCGRLYVPNVNLTVDEQLLEFRGSCPFRMYIPNKAAKYGIKLFLICDSESKYMLNAMPYLGKGDATPRDGVNLGHYYTRELTRPYHGTNRNVTTDNWFTSVPLTSDLLTNCGMTLVGTLRATKKEIPAEMKKKETRAYGSSAFLYTKEMTMVSYVAKTSRTKKKMVLLLSSQHTHPVLAANGKPEILEFYNATKGGVDTFDQMCAVSSCSRKTRRWSLCVMYGMLNAACINSYIICRENWAKNGIVFIQRRSYLLELGRGLITPWAQARLSSPFLSRPLQTVITTVCDLPSLDSARPSATSMADNRSRLVRCVDCPRKSDRKTRFRCNKCDKPKCPRHLYPICGDCL